LFVVWINPVFSSSLVMLQGLGCSRIGNVDVATMR
jgi:hypothetical protein